MSLEIAKVGSAFIPNWIVLLVIVVLVLYAFGLWSKIIAWAKLAYTKATGKPAEGGFFDAVDGFVLGAESYKVQGALRIARIEFAEREDEESMTAIDLLLTRAAVWMDEEVEDG